MTKYLLSLLSLLLLLSSAPAFADYPLQPRVETYATRAGSPQYTSKQAACDYGYSLYAGSDKAAIGTWVVSGNTCIGSKQAYTMAAISITLSSSCPYGGTANATTCVGADMPPPPPPTCTGGVRAVYKYKVTSATGADLGPHGTTASDGNSCQVSLDAVRDCYQNVDHSVDKSQWCYYDTLSTGSQSKSSDYPADRTGGVATQTENADANSAATPRVNAPPQKAIQGQCYTGMVQAGVDSDGTPICMGSGTQPPPGAAATPKPTVITAPTVTIQNADGSSTTQTTTTTKNADGSSTTTVDKITTAPDGTKTVDQTKQTSSNTAGNPGTATPATPDAPDLCAKNPTLTICRNSSVSGTCGAIACNGDAVQCATLRAAALMQCQQAKDITDAAASPLNSLGSAASGGNDPSKGTFPSAANATVVQAGSLSADGWLGGGACFADKTFVVQGRSFVVPLSKTCDYLLALRYGLMALAGLVSFRMLSGAILT